MNTSILTFSEPGVPTWTYKWMVPSMVLLSTSAIIIMCKDEPKELRQLISRNQEKLPGNCTQKSRLLKIGNTLISHRILSAQEAVYRTTGLHLRGSLRGT